MTVSESRPQGFTLLEMLVVLLIAGMALALTSQALTQYKRAHERVSSSTQGGREYRLAERWFRDSVSGLFAAGDPGKPLARPASNVASKPEDALVFRGDEQGFSGLTLLPVLTGQGAPMLQSWSVTPTRSGNDTLTLDEDGRQLALPFPDAGHLTLHYMDAKGEFHAQWPPAQGQWPQLPAAIALGLGSGPVIVAAITGPQNPQTIPYEPEPL